MIQKVWDESRIADRIQLRAIRQRRPLSCTLELTYRCNFCCKMCYIRMTDVQAAPFGRMRTVEEWLDMARQLRDAGVLYLNLTGGECTQYPGFIPLYEQLSQMGFRLSIMSNAGAYTESIRDIFRKYPPDGVAITLYGGSDTTYEVVTGDARGLSKALENIRFFHSIGVPVKLNFTMIRQNVLDYPKVAAVCQDLKLPFTLITDITGHQQNLSFSGALDSRLTPAERACVTCHQPDEVEIALENAKELEKMLQSFQLPSAPAEPVAYEQDACIGGSTGCAIFWNGEMNTCISMRRNNPVHPFEIGFEAAWQQLKARQDETFRRPAACTVCNMSSDCLHNCAARRFEGMGSTQEPDPYTCQYTYLLRLYRAKRKELTFLSHRLAPDAAD